MWQHRIMLETLCHSENAFVTLTYADDMLPAGLSLQPAHMQSFLKRLRERMSPIRLRFYGVGEYGDQTQRPHYHLILFGYPNCLRGRSVYSRVQTRCCSSCDRVMETWGQGHISLGSVTLESASYVCGYIVKNMRRTDDHRLNGRWPEFCRMSLKPGIGYNAMWEVADAMMCHGLDASEYDVPKGLRHGKSVRPLGRYLRKSLRKMVGRDEKAPVEVDPEVFLMYQAAKDATPMGGEARKVVFKNMLLDAGEQRVLQVEARLKLYSSRRVV